MNVLKINDLEAGMEIAEPVKNLQGKILFTTGSVITEKHLKAFKAWGVTEVSIIDEGELLDAQSEDENAGEANEATMISKIEERMTDQFLLTDRNDPVIKELYRIVVERAESKPE